MKPGRFAALTLLAAAAIVTGCDAGSDAIAPDPSGLKGGSKSIDDLVCDMRVSRITLDLAASTVTVGGTVNASAVM